MNMYSNLGNIYREKRTNPETGEIFYAYWIMTIDNDLQNTHYLTYNSKSRYIGRYNSLPEDAELVGYCPFMPMDGDNAVHEITGEIIYRDPDSEGEDITAKVKAIQQYCFITEDDDRIYFWWVKNISYYTRNMNVLRVSHNNSNVNIYRTSRTTLGTNGDCVTHVLLWVEHENDINIGDAVSVNAYSNPFAALITEGCEDYDKLNKFMPLRYLSVSSMGRGNVVLVDNFNNTYTLPSFAISKERLSRNKVKSEALLSVGSLITSIYGSGKYVVLGTNYGGYICEPEESIYNNSPTKVVDGIPVDDEYVCLLYYCIDDYAFVGKTEVPVRWMMFNNSSIKIPSMEVVEYEVGDDVVIKSEDDIIIDCGCDNDGNPNTLAKYTPAIRDMGGQTVKITGVYDSRYTVSGLDDVLISADMIEGSNYRLPRKEDITGNDNYANIRKNMAKDMSGIIDDNTQIAVNMRYNGIMLNARYYVYFTEEHTVIAPNMRSVPITQFIDMGMEYALNSLTKHIVTWKNTTPENIAELIASSMSGVAVSSIIYNEEVLYARFVGTTTSNDYVFGKNAQ